MPPPVPPYPNAASLAKALTEGAKENGNEIKEDYITSMNIKACIGCGSCMRTHNGCVQKNDDMAGFSESHKKAVHDAEFPNMLERAFKIGTGTIE